MNDPIIEEIRKYRNEHTERYENNLDRIVAALRHKEKQSGRPIVDFGPRPL